MVTKEELARKLATKVSEEEFENLSADVVLLAQKLATHIEEEDVHIEEKVTELVTDKVTEIVEEKVPEIVEDKIDEVIDEKLEDYVKQDDLTELDNRYLQFEQVEDVED